MVSETPSTTEKQLAALLSQVRECRACEEASLLAKANPIHPPAPGDPRLMLVGQAPGLQTDRAGYHFAGPAGRLLEQWFERAGFPPGYFRAHVYLTSLTRCFPGKAASGTGDRRPSPSELRLCRPFLSRELALVQPRLVVLVGTMAIDAFLGPAPLGLRVGSVHERDGRLFLPLPHASGVSRWLNQPENRVLLDRALAELSRLREDLRLDAP